MPLTQVEKQLLRKAIRDKNITDDAELDAIGQSDTMARELISGFATTFNVQILESFARHKENLAAQLANIEAREAEVLETQELINQLTQE